MLNSTRWQREIDKLEQEILLLQAVRAGLLRLCGPRRGRPVGSKTKPRPIETVDLLHDVSPERMAQIAKATVQGNTKGYSE